MSLLRRSMLRLALAIVAATSVSVATAACQYSAGQISQLRAQYAANQAAANQNYALYQRYRSDQYLRAYNLLVQQNARIAQIINDCNSPNNNGNSGTTDGCNCRPIYEREGLNSYNRAVVVINGLYSQNYWLFQQRRLTGFVLKVESPSVYCPCRYEPQSRPRYYSLGEILNALRQLKNNGYRISSIGVY